NLATYSSASFLAPSVNGGGFGICGLTPLGNHKPLKSGWPPDGDCATALPAPQVAASVATAAAASKRPCIAKNPLSRPAAIVPLFSPRHEVCGALHRAP